jgi:hypothetical protein
VAEPCFETALGFRPERVGLGVLGAALRRQGDQPVAPVVRIDPYGDETVALQRFQRVGERAPDRGACLREAAEGYEECFVAGKAPSLSALLGLASVEAEPSGATSAVCYDHAERIGGFGCLRIGGLERAGNGEAHRLIAGVDDEAELTHLASACPKSTLI